MSATYEARLAVIWSRGARLHRGTILARAVPGPTTVAVMGRPARDWWVREATRLVGAGIALDLPMEPGGDEADEAIALAARHARGTDSAEGLLVALDSGVAHATEHAGYAMAREAAREGRTLVLHRGMGASLAGLVDRPVRCWVEQRGRAGQHTPFAPLPLRWAAAREGAQEPGVLLVGERADGTELARALPALSRLDDAAECIAGYIAARRVYNATAAAPCLGAPELGERPRWRVPTDCPETLAAACGHAHMGVLVWRPPAGADIRPGAGAIARAIRLGEVPCPALGRGATLASRPALVVLERPDGAQPGDEEALAGVLRAQRAAGVVP